MSEGSAPPEPSLRESLGKDVEASMDAMLTPTQKFAKGLFNLGTGRTTAMTAMGNIAAGEAERAAGEVIAVVIAKGLGLNLRRE